MQALRYSDEPGLILSRIDFKNTLTRQLRGIGRGRVVRGLETL
jgi:hypothetical protein